MLRGAKGVPDILRDTPLFWRKWRREEKDVDEGKKRDTATENAERTG